MKLRSRLIGLAGVLAVACSPQPAATAAGTADAPKNPFFGRWQLTRAQIAPWWDGKGDEPIADPALTMIEFGADKSSGAPIVACDKPQYAVSKVAPPALFEGNLADPFPQARMLGFLDQEITMLHFGCTSGGADVSLDFPMHDEATIMLGLDNMIYTFTRTPD